MPLNALAGTAADEVNILNVNSLNQVISFYSAGNFSPEGTDQCLSHPADNSKYHYHITSECMVNPSQGNLTICSPTMGYTK